MPRKSHLAGKNNNRGLTFIELLVTIAIIGTLASVSYVFYDNYEESARRKADYINQENALALAKTAYLTGYLGDAELNFSENFPIYNDDGTPKLNADGSPATEKGEILYYNAQDGVLTKTAPPPNIDTDENKNKYKIYKIGQSETRKDRYIKIYLTQKNGDAKLKWATTPPDDELNALKDPAMS